LKAQAATGRAPTGQCIPPPGEGMPSEKDLLSLVEPVGMLPFSWTDFLGMGKYWTNLQYSIPFWQK
jgi:hypothetical protein